MPGRCYQVGGGQSWEHQGKAPLQPACHRHVPPLASRPPCRRREFLDVPSRSPECEPAPADAHGGQTVEPFVEAGVSPRIL